MSLLKKYTVAKNRKRGFTLVEMAIVMGVAGLLFGGLWRILSTSNVQMRDQATANQQAQLISAVTTYLQTDEGQTWMAKIGSLGTQTLILPTPANPAGSGIASPASGCYNDPNMTSKPAGYPTHASLCGILPPGFSTSTTNPYGQTYQVNVLKDGSNTGVKPQTYSFMILTLNGDTIPDTSGGRISGMIGGDGGFMYSTSPCGNTVCGAFGSWNADWNGYFSTPGLGTPGHVASRTYYAPSQNFNSSWLARLPIDPTNNLNTMQTTLFMGGNQVSLTAQTPGTPGQIYGSVPAGTVANPFISLDSSSMPLATAKNTNSLIILNAPCTTRVGSLKYSAICAGALQIIEGDIQLGDGVMLSESYVYSNPTPSDFRLKKDIKPLDGSLDKIMDLRPVSFAYKSDNRQTMGVIAQELEKIYPQLVITGANGMKYVGYEGLIAPLIDSVQELKKENDSLKSQLHEQSERQQKIEDEIESLRH